jgi:hypothetical protein
MVCVGFEYCVSRPQSKVEGQCNCRKLPKLSEWGCEQSADDFVRRRSVLERGEGVVNLFMCNREGAPYSYTPQSKSVSTDTQNLPPP